MDGPGHLMLVIERTHLGAQILGAKVSPFDNQREVARPVRSAWHSVPAMQPSLGLGSLAATI